MSLYLVLCTRMHSVPHPASFAGLAIAYTDRYKNDPATRTTCSSKPELYTCSKSETLLNIQRMCLLQGIKTHPCWHELYRTRELAGIAFYLDYKRRLLLKDLFITQYPLVNPTQPRTWFAEQMHNYELSWETTKERQRSLRRWKVLYQTQRTDIVGLKKTLCGLTRDPLAQRLCQKRLVELQKHAHFLMLLRSGF